MNLSLRSIVFCLGCSLLSVATSFGQNGTTEVSFATIESKGESALTAPVTVVPPFLDDLRTKRILEVDEQVLDENAAPVAAPTATPLMVPAPAPQTISLNPRNFSGFNGITNLSQRLAGTGIYTNTQFSVEPPDQALAAGRGFVLEAVNDALAVYDRNGTLLSGPTPLNQFFNLRPGFDRNTGLSGEFVSDPKAYFDRQTQRWFVTVLEIDVDPPTGNFLPHSHLMFAVSQTHDPTQKWNLFSIDTTDDGTNGTQVHPHCPCFGDQPLIGADRHGFYLSTNEFAIAPGTGSNRAQIYALSKRLLTQGILPTVVHFSSLVTPEGRAFSIQPSVSPTRDFSDFDRDADDRGVEFLMSTPRRAILDNRLIVWALTNTRSLVDVTPNVQLAHVSINSETFGFPNDAVQKVGPTPLGTLLGNPEELVQTNDQRLQQVVFANGRLWSAVTTSIAQGPNCVSGFESDCVAGIAWFVVRPEVEESGLQAKIHRQGYLSLQGENIFFPSVAINEDGRGAIAFSLSGPDFFPSSAFAKVHESHVGNVELAAAGVAPEDGFSGYAALGGNGSARWGDYTAAVADGDSIWFATEFIPGGARARAANWGTFVGRLSGEDDDDR